MCIRDSNDKVYQLGPCASRPLGHWRNAVVEAEKEDVQKEFEQRAAVMWPNIDEDLEEIRAERARDAAEKKTRKRKAEGEAQ